jgi:hypothetical protein
MPLLGIPWWLLVPRVGPATSLLPLAIWLALTVVAWRNGWGARAFGPSGVQLVGAIVIVGLMFMSPSSRSAQEHSASNAVFLGLLLGVGTWAWLLYLTFRARTRA